MTSTWVLERLGNDVVAAGLVAVCLYTFFRFIYNFNLHPASVFPGPKLAAVSNIWYAYHRAAGRYPSVVARALGKYGDVVRVAPNELVFITPQAFSGTSDSRTSGLEHFPMTNFMDLGLSDNGISWEMDPVKHHADAKRLAPAFAHEQLRQSQKQLTGTLTSSLKKMKDIGSREEGIELKTMTMDISADLAYSREMHHLRDKISFTQLGKILLCPPVYTIELLQISLDCRGDKYSLDHFEQLLPGDAETPTSQEFKHLEVAVEHLVIAGYEPPASQMLCTLMFSLLEPENLVILTSEIRGAFDSYEAIHGDKVGTLQYLDASLMETLRNYLQYGVLAFTRDPRYFWDGQSYRPQRWLPRREAYHPFSRGPRACPGSTLAWRETKLFIAKVLWTFDIDMVANQNIVFEKDFRMCMWQKPKFWVRFHIRQ
ncbi:cytochrome P450 [Xylariaceae sp. FL0255]|nr:cytochrome P450 [Xylariaceae sp. FL0255]